MTKLRLKLKLKSGSCTRSGQSLYQRKGTCSNEKWINVIVTVAIMAGAGYWLYEKYKPQPEAPIEVPPPITFEVTRQTMTQTIQVKGKSVYTDQTDVFAPYAASIKQWNVKNGQQVKKGDVLFTLDTSTLQTEVQQLQSDLEKAKLEIEINQVTMDQADMSASLGVTEEERKRRLPTGRVNA